MEEESQTSNAIIPEDKNRQLSLPIEMIQRGLELAIRIEQKQGIQQFPAKLAKKEYLVRCYLSIMEWVRKEDRTYRLNGSDKHTTNAPVYFVLSVDRDGLYISLASKNLTLVGSDGNENRYRLLNAFSNVNPFKIPVSSFGLYYVLTHPADDSILSRGPLSQMPKEALKNLLFKLGPGGGQPGYKGPATKEANHYFDINRDCVETVIIYISMLADPNSNTSVIAKDPPLKLGLVAIDKMGIEDLVASRELYHAILEIKDPLAAQKVYVSIEELYKNIPVSVAYEKDWKQWENAYEGRYVKERGRFDGVSIHPREGKLFFIVTMVGGKGSVENKPRQVALWVEDAHQLKLGEKEGSFLLDGIKRIYLGETYAFKGRVSKFSLFDKELRNTDFRDLITVKTKIENLDFE